MPKIKTMYAIATDMRREFPPGVVEVHVEDKGHIPRHGHTALSLPDTPGILDGDTFYEGPYIQVSCMVKLSSPQVRIHYVNTLLFADNPAIMLFTTQEEAEAHLARVSSIVMSSSGVEYKYKGWKYRVPASVCPKCASYGFPTVKDDPDLSAYKLYCKCCNYATLSSKPDISWTADD